MKMIFRKYPKWFLHYKVKLFSLLCAFFLWFYVVTDNTFDHTLSIPLRIKNKPEGWILKQSVPSKVRVEFKGVGKDLISLGYRDKRIELDLHQMQGVEILPITTDMIMGIPENGTITPIRIVEPDSIEVSLDRFATKKIPLRSDITLIPMDGYMQVGDIALEPDSVLLSGPESLVRDIDAISTEGEEYRSVIKKIEGKVALKSPAWKTLHYSINAVRFKADIQRIGERIITDIPVRVTNVPPEMKVTLVPSTLSLKLQGGVNVLSKLKKEEIAATIDFNSRLRYKENKIPATIALPSDISFSDVKPQFFEIIIER